MIAPPPSDCRPRYAAAYALSSMCAGCAPAWAYQTLHCSPFAVARAWPAYLSALALACCSVDPDDRPKSSALAASLAAKTGTQEADA